MMVCKPVSLAVLVSMANAYFGLCGEKPSRKDSETPAAVLKNWKEHRPKNNRFTIMLPPGGLTGKGEMAGGSLKTPVEFSQGQFGKAIYTAMFMKFPPALVGKIPPDTPPEKILGLFREFVAEKLGKVVGEKKLKQGMLHGMEYKVNEVKDGRIGRVQMYWVEPYLLTASVVGEPEAVNSKEAEAFFASFKIAPINQKSKE